jgi:hypothetical protein
LRLKISVFRNPIGKSAAQGADAMVKEHGADILGAEDFKNYKRLQDFAHHIGDILYVAADAPQCTHCALSEILAFILTPQATCESAPGC